ncbi:MAG: outer membrane beta-barrel protein [Kiritimatiellae bacterium]|nr:outer membrane beta-barrel protein [Kiritimatiellia bacterium]
MNRRIQALALAAGIAAAAAFSAHAEALVTKGSSELGIGGNLDFKSAVGTDVSLGVRYAYFFWDQISLGGTVGVADNDAATSFKIGGVGEYNFKLSDNYQPVIGTDLVPFVGLGLSYQHVDIHHEKENALVFTTEAGIKFFLTDSAAVITSGIFDLATKDIFPDDDDANKWNFALNLGMRFYF